jgi:arsenate reductase
MSKSLDILLNKMTRFKFMHNPNCSKSRECMQFLVESGAIKSTELVEYLTAEISKSELLEMLKAMDNCTDAIRTQGLSESELEMAKSGNLQHVFSLLEKDISRLQRPIVWDLVLNKAVVGRPLELVKDLVALPK